MSRTILIDEKTYKRLNRVRKKLYEKNKNKSLPTTKIGLVSLDKRPDGTEVIDDFEMCNDSQYFGGCQAAPAINSGRATEAALRLFKRGRVVRGVVRVCPYEDKQLYFPRDYNGSRLSKQLQKKKMVLVVINQFERDDVVIDMQTWDKAQLQQAKPLTKGGEKSGI